MALINAPHTNEDKQFPPLTDEQVEDLLIHAGPDGDPVTGAVNVPIYQTSTFRQNGIDVTPTWEYSRTGNPTRAASESVVAALENGRAAFAFASGMAAVSTALELLEPGSAVVTSENVYGGTYRVLEGFFSRYGISHRVANTTDAAAFEQALESIAAEGERVSGVLLESPGNPLLEVSDIAAIARIAHAHGALLIVDNTFMSPYLQRPLELGADIVVHSATKYLGGHSDVIGGFVVVRDAKLAERVAWLQNALGAISGPQDSFLLLRGIKTLGVRLDRQSANALAVAEYLADDARVAAVHYPGLPSDPGYETQLRQAKTGGAMVSFELAESIDPVAFFPALKTFVLAESLGGVESLSCYPPTMTHAAVPADERERMGITDHLVRLSVGLEPVSVMQRDLDQALSQASR